MNIKLTLVFHFWILILWPLKSHSFLSCDLDSNGTYKTLSAKIPKDQNLDFKKMAKLARKTKDLEKTLKNLKKTNPEYLKFHNLLYCSFSVQEASPTEPRAVVFGPKADFIFTFNGGPHQDGGSALETVTFNQKTKEFEFREIAFRKKGEVWDDLIEPHEINRKLSNESVRISKSNPQKCMGCHTSNGKRVGLNWPSYFLWPLRLW